MGQLYFITAYPRPFPEGQAFLMTRDLSHEEERKSEWGKLPVERDGRDRARMKSKAGRGEMKRASKRLVVDEKEVSQAQ